MARAGVYVEIFGDKHLMHTMNSWAVRAADALPAYEAMHRYILGVEEELFETEGASGADGSWAPRENNFRHTDEGNPILQATGALMRSLTDSDDPHHKWIPTPSGFAFGTTDPKAEYHQTGTEFMVQRKVVDFTAENRAVLVETLHLWITRAGLTPASGGAFFSRVRGSGGRFIG